MKHSRKNPVIGHWKHCPAPNVALQADTSVPNHRSWTTAIGAAVVALALCANSFGQKQDPGSAGAATAATDESLIILSPFEVRTGKDNGFIASSSLAGGRLAGDLKDTPVAYSVLTRDFIDALQLTDLTELVKWAPNSYDLPDNLNGGGATGDSFHIASRGVASNRPQRNFFPVYYNFDSYNLDRLDLARGPNAILFGSSGVGGTANSVTKRAQTDRRFGEIRVSDGPYGGFRTTLDYNQPMGKTVALRLNALYNDRKGWRDGDIEGRKGVTLAAFWRPLHNTEIRVEGERGRTARPVFTTNLDDQVSGWDGKSTYSARIAGANNPAGILRQGLRTAVFTPSGPAGTLVNYEGWAVTQGGNFSATTPAGGVIVVGPTANIANNSIIYQKNLFAGLYDQVVNNSKFRIPPREASTGPSGPNFIVNSENATLSVTQRLGENFFAEVAGNVGREITDTDIGITRQMSRVYLDVNSVLPDGRSNPNSLQPYSYGQPYPYHQTHDDRNLRAALGYTLNGTRLGNFRFNIVSGVSSSSFDRNAYRYMLKTNPDPRQWPTFAPVSFRYYLNTDKDRPMPQPDSWTYLDPVANTTTTVPAGRVRDYINTSFNQLNKIDTNYVQSAANAKLFKGRLHLLAAARRDGYKTHQDSIALQFDNPLNWDGVTRNIKPPAPSDWATLTYRTRNANGNPFGAALPADTRPRLTTGGERNPLYATDRFRDDYSPPNLKDSVTTYTAGSVYHATKNVSAFVNYAQSYAPPGVNLKIDGSVFQPVASDGWDYGLRFTFLDGGLVVNATRYQGQEKNRQIGSSPIWQNFNAIIQANPLNDLTPGAVNSRGLLPLPQGYVDSAAAKTSGSELEITANLTPNWRLLLNGAMPKAIQINPNRESIDYFNKNKETLKQIVVDAGGTFNGDLATFTATAPQQSGTGPLAVNGWNNLVANLAALASGQTINRVTELTANLYTDYRVSAGRLKGLRAGGGLNYRGRQVIGNKGAETIRNSANPTSSIDDPNVGPLDYVYMNPYVTGTLTFSYSYRLSQKYTLGFDLKIDNLFDYAKPIYFNTILRPVGGDLTNPGRVATPNNFSWIAPRSYTLTASVKF